MTDEVHEAAIEAAQRVVDDDERSRILAEINAMKDGDSSPPQVRSARPAV